MSDHHKDASVRVARTLLAGMSLAEQADVQVEADREGVSAVEIVRRSLDILIADSGALSRQDPIPGPPPGALPH